MSESEFVRRFIVDGFSFDQSMAFSEIFEVKLGYVSMNPDDGEVVLTKAEKNFFISIGKTCDNGVMEYNSRIGKKQFRDLWPSTQGRRIVKVRNVMYFGNYKIMIDQYKGNLLGLTMAEVVFDKKKNCEKFSIPDWFGKEISDDSMFLNSSLALVKKLDELGLKWKSA